VSRPIFADRYARHFQAVRLLKLGYAHEAMGSPEAVGYRCKRGAVGKPSPALK
jgi:hypothetical protein